MKLHELSALQLALLLRKRCLSATEMACYFLERIRRADMLDAFSVIADQAALEQAAKVDAMFAAGQQVSPLQGVPIALKDHIEWQGLPIELGSRSRKGVVSDHSANIIQRLLDQGLVLLGKTRVTEYGFGLSGINPTTHTPRNPWDAKMWRIPGGSSSGAAVAVAAGLSPLALGGDSGGSVRAPAAFQHLVGLKPSSSLIDRQGCVPLAASLDIFGPIAHTVEDVRALLSVAASGAADQVPDLEREPLRCLAVLDEGAWPTTLSVDVESAWRRALDTLRTNEVELKFWCAPQALLWSSLSRDNSLILAYEAYHTYRDIIETVNPDIWSVVLTRMRRGGQIGRQAYRDALLRRIEAKQQFTAAFAKLEAQALLLPCCPFVAPPIEEFDEQNDAVGLWLRAANFLDACAISLPVSLGSDGLPVAIQLMTPESTDLQLLSVAEQLETLFDQKGVRPDLSPWALAQ